ncbi:MAG: hypothetical protein WBD41_27880 [Rhodococcus sp. (in: high G+C Gram-positive bacteria)]|jgi:hypothetical protein
MNHDRTGDTIEEPSTERHDPNCRAGWLGADSEGRPIPCRICKPHLFVNRVVYAWAPK